MSPIGWSARECSPPCAGCSSGMADIPGVPGRFLLNTSARTCSPRSRTPFRDLADSCLLLVDRELQLAHDHAQLLQRLVGFALLAQDHEIVGVGYDTTAEALLQSELLPPQYKPAHVYIRQQR